MTESSSTTVQTLRGKRRIRLKWRLTAALILLAGVLSTGYWWGFMRHRAFTDDAYTTADSAAVSSRVPGSIAKIQVDNDDLVNAGDLLLELDPRDYQARVDKYIAALTRVEAQIKAEQTTIPLTAALTDAQLQAAQAGVEAAMHKQRQAAHHVKELQQVRTGVLAELGRTERDNKRYQNLYRQGAGSAQQRDRNSTQFKKAQAQLAAIEAQIAAAGSSLAAAGQEIDRAKAALETASANRRQVEIEKLKLAALKAQHGEIAAELRTARLNLSYCAVRAPIAGYIAQKRIQVGDRVQPGQGLLAVVPLQDIYVEANFKETQLGEIRLGQPVDIEADIYPDHLYHGRVVGIRAGTGAAFSLLPAENATGNWIKVVQRIPVKIRLDAPPPRDYPLRVGLSLGVTVFTEDQSGPRLVQKQLVQSHQDTP